jgi:hypothetical protein
VLFVCVCVCVCVTHSNYCYKLQVIERFAHIIQDMFRSDLLEVYNMYACMYTIHTYVCIYTHMHIIQDMFRSDLLEVPSYFP